MSVLSGTLANGSQYDEKRWSELSTSLRWRGEHFVTAFFGERCEEREDGCPICQRWAALDALLENPFQG